VDKCKREFGRQVNSTLCATPKAAQNALGELVLDKNWGQRQHFYLAAFVTDLNSALMP